MREQPRIEPGGSHRRRDYIAADGRGGTETVALLGVPTGFGDRLADLLCRQSLRLHRFQTLAEARESGVLGDCDLVLIEALPGGQTDFTACHQVAAASDAAILALADRSDEGSSVLALELGADGWMSSDASDREALARFRALFRLRERLRRSMERPPDVRLDSWMLRRDRRELTHVDGRTCRLTPVEFNLLQCFLANPERPLTPDELMTATGSEGVAKSVSVAISRLQRKLEAGGDDLPRIRNVRGSGYVLD